jgi:hypothetical protein
MNSAEWIAIVAPALAVTGTGLAAVVKLTRIVDAVERLEKTFTVVMRRLDDHERRLNRARI